MFTPLEILYIVLAFCALWLSVVIFWLIWQMATMLKRVNDTVGQAQETLAKIQLAIDGIRSKFDHTSTALGAILHTGTKAVEYLIDKRMQKKAPKEKKKKSEE
ncbi:MAG: hypothetical protein WC654_00560 [Patescibacteria group bacterium]